MAGSAEEVSDLQRLIERYANGDDSVLNDLLVRVSDRLERLTRSMLNEFSRVRRWEETSDIVQNASVRLFRTFQATRPTDVRGFFALATLQIRRELLDLARHYYGPQGLGANHESRSDWADGSNQSPSPFAASGSFDPHRLSAWSEFHERVGGLPDDEREVFDLVYYQGLSQIEAAQLLGISERTLRRRWQAASAALNVALGGQLPT